MNTPREYTLECSLKLVVIADSEEEAIKEATGEIENSLDRVSDVDVNDVEAGECLTCHGTGEVTRETLNPDTHRMEPTDTGPCECTLE